MHEAFLWQVLPGQRLEDIQRYHNSHPRIYGLLQERAIKYRLINTDFSKMIPKLKHWLQIDFSTLRKPQLNYKNQMQIDPHRVCIANTAMAHFGLDPGRFVQWMGGKYTGQLRDAYFNPSCSQRPHLNQRLQTNEADPPWRMSSPAQLRGTSQQQDWDDRPM